MAKWIDANCLIEELEEQKLTCKSSASIMLLDYMISLLRLLPRTDAVEVVHGRWIAKDVLIRSPLAKNHYCSECREETNCKSNYCPNCGADMRGGKHEID